MACESGDNFAESTAEGIPSIRVEESLHQQSVLDLGSVSENTGNTNCPDDTQLCPSQEEITRPPTAISFVPSTADATSPPSSPRSPSSPSSVSSVEILFSFSDSESMQNPVGGSQASWKDMIPDRSKILSPVSHSEQHQALRDYRPQQPVSRRASLSSVPRILDVPDHPQPSRSCPSSPRVREASVSQHPSNPPSSPPLDDLSVDDDGTHFQHIPSSAYQEWETRKLMRNSENNDEEDRPRLRRDPESIIDELMKLKGLEEVKRTFLDILTKVEICKKQGRDLKKERFNVVFQGNPGTGKTTVARLYAEFLHAVGVLSSRTIKETSGMAVAAKGARGIKKKIKKMLSRKMGGVLFVDEAYLLTAEYMDGLGRRALDIILTQMENNIGKLVVIFVGYKDELEPFFEHNPGLSSRIPYTINFVDFTDWELWKIMNDLISTQWNGRMRVEGGMKGLYMRIAIRRLAQNRGSRGFGNARAVENLLSNISTRQARRLGEEARQGRRSSDYLLLTKEDLIGPDPSQASVRCPAWAELQKLVGLEQVKECVKRTIGMISRNYQRDLRERKPLKLSLNQLFVGAPGTGKTTVAKLYGKILADLGYLSRGDVVLKTPADFIGECLGKSEAKTKKILEATIGKVLVIDEAYMLDAGDPGKDQDKFKTGVIDTLVSMVQGVPGEDRCIILVGYEDKMKAMFRNVNPGLSRRFPVERPFRFENFNVAQLVQILRKKMAEGDLESTPEAIDAAKAIFERALMRPNFTNAGEVDSCLATAKLNYEARISRQPFDLQDPDAVFEAVDFDPDWDRGSHAGELDCRAALEGRVHADIVDTLVSIHKRCFGAKNCGINPREVVATNFVFKGPPGTGKTTTALQMGKLFYGMGFLSTDEVIECSAGDLLGQYVGHTGPKTRQKLQEAMGRVLFIDEADRFMGSQYAGEALDELVNSLTKPANYGKTIVILAGYTEDMNFLMSRRPVLAGLFREEIVFNHIPPQDCMSLLARELAGVHQAFRLQPTFLTDSESQHYKYIQRLFRVLQLIPGWSNARDIKNIAKQIMGMYLESRSDGTSSPGTDAFLPEKQVIDCMREMIKQQRGRYKFLGTGLSTQWPLLEPPLGAPDTGSAMVNPQLAPPPAGVNTEIQATRPDHTDTQGHSGAANGTSTSQQQFDAAIMVDMKPNVLDIASEHDHDYRSTTRENGVSDAVWKQLLAAQKIESTRRDKRDARREDLLRELGEKEAALSHGNPSRGDGADLEAVCNGLRRQLEDIERQMQDEEKIQQALERANQCENGYMYTRVGNGYRCDGGMHYITDAEVHAHLR